MSLERLMLEQQMRAIEDEERRTPEFYLEYVREVATAFHKYFTRLALEGRAPIYAARRAAGCCVSCRAALKQGVRCERCAESHRRRNRAGYFTPSGKRQTADLAEHQAFKKGGASLAKEEEIPMAEPRIDMAFVRAQCPQAVPLLAKLYSVSEDKIREIRVTGCAYVGQRMPLRLLRELVEQRKATIHIEHFIEGKSSIVRCEEA